MMMEQETTAKPAKEKKPAFDLGANDLGKINTPTRRDGARTVNVGEDVMSPAPIAIPASTPNTSKKQNKSNIPTFSTTTNATINNETKTSTSKPTQPVLEDPFGDDTNATTAPATTTTSAPSPPPTTTTRKDTADSISSDSPFDTTTSTSKPTENDTASTKSVAMRVSNLDQDTITRIRRESQCSIVVSIITGKEQSVTLSGTSENVRTAQTLIRRHVASNEYTPTELLDGEAQFFETKKAYYLGPISNSKSSSSSTSTSNQAIHGHLRITMYRLIFTPFDATSSKVRRLLDSNILQIPLFTMSRCKTAIRNNNPRK